MLTIKGSLPRGNHLFPGSPGSRPGLPRAAQSLAGVSKLLRTHVPLAKVCLLPTCRSPSQCSHGALLNQNESSSWSLMTWEPGLSSLSLAMFPDPLTLGSSHRSLEPLCMSLPFWFIPLSSLSVRSVPSQVQVRALFSVPQPLCSPSCSAVAECCDCLDPLPPQHYL